MTRGLRRVTGGRSRRLTRRVTRRLTGGRHSGSEATCSSNLILDVSADLPFWVVMDIYNVCLGQHEAVSSWKVKGVPDARYSHVRCQVWKTGSNLVRGADSEIV